MGLKHISYIGFSIENKMADLNTCTYWSGFKLFFFRHVGDRQWRGWSSVFQDSVKNMAPRSWMKSPNSFCDFLATTIFFRTLAATVATAAAVVVVAAISAIVPSAVIAAVVLVSLPPPPPPPPPPSLPLPLLVDCCLLFVSTAVAVSAAAAVVAVDAPKAVVVVTTPAAVAVAVFVAAITIAATGNAVGGGGGAELMSVGRPHHTEKEEFGGDI